nr:uncharacterized protein LOC121125364 [Lepeophtheirus salmonis]
MKTEDLEKVLTNYNHLVSAKYSATQRLVVIDYSKRVLAGGLCVKIELTSPVITQSRTNIFGFCINIQSVFTFRTNSYVTIPFQTDLSVAELIAQFKNLFRIVQSNPIYVFEKSTKGSDVLYRRLVEHELPFGACINWVLRGDQDKEYVFRDEYPEIHDSHGMYQKGIEE